MVLVRQNYVSLVMWHEKCGVRVSRKALGVHAGAARLREGSYSSSDYAYLGKPLDWLYQAWKGSPSSCVGQLPRVFGGNNDRQLIGHD